MIRFLKALIFVIFLLATNAKGDGNLILETNAAKWTLYEVDDAEEHNEYFGRYRHYSDHLGGRYFDLFPDYKFIIIDFCDICENATVGYGTFEIKQSKIMFNYELAPSNKIQSLNIRRGRQEKEGYVTGSINVLLSDKQLDKLKNEPKSDDYVYQIKHYYPWGKIKDELMENVVFP